MIVRIGLFLIVFAVLELGWQQLAGTDPGRALIERGVVAPAAALLRVLNPTRPVRAEGNALLAPGGGVRVVNGCDGMEALLMLVAGVCIVPATRRARLGALAVGAVLVYALNLTRLLVLFDAQLAGPAAFDLWHSLLGPVLMVAAILGFFHVWFHGPHAYARGR